MLKHKDEIHAEEDPAFLDTMSDILDIRNWTLGSFDPTDPDNEKQKKGRTEIEKMVTKLKKYAVFYEDLDADDIEKEFRESLDIIYEHEAASKDLSREAKLPHTVLLGLISFLLAQYHRSMDLSSQCDSFSGPNFAKALV